MEEWKVIEGFEYSVSNEGRVRNDKTGSYIKPRLNKFGYLRVNLRDSNKKQKGFTLHRLIAIAFIDNPLNKPQINHINGIKTDNSINNLEWCTSKENQLHKSQTLKKCRGEENSGGGALTEFEVLIICEMFKKLSFIKIAKIMNVSKGLIREIAHAKLWTTVTEKVPHVPFYTLNEHRFTEREVLYICELYKTGLYTRQKIADMMQQPLFKVSTIFDGTAHASKTKDLKYLPYHKKKDPRN